MLHQNNSRVQKPRRGCRRRNCHEIACRIDEPEKRVRPLFRERAPYPFFGQVSRSDVAPVDRAADTLARQHDREQPRQHLRQWNDRAECATGIALDRVEGYRVVETDVATPTPTEGEQVGANAEALTEI